MIDAEILNNKYHTNNNCLSKVKVQVVFFFIDEILHFHLYLFATSSTTSLG